MNERIKELAEQADDYADAMDIGGKNYIGLRDECFAELIVRECISICKEKELPNLYGIREVENTIKQHFGVEE